MDLAARMLGRSIGAEQACRSIVAAAIDRSGAAYGQAALLARTG
jgi:hypothetical protein